jgi:hypothetical protein
VLWQELLPNRRCSYCQSKEAIKKQIRSATLSTDVSLSEVRILSFDFKEEVMSKIAFIWQWEETNEYEKGYIQALSDYAHWKDGTQYVGSCGTTLAEAIDEFMHARGRTKIHIAYARRAYEGVISNVR